MVKAARARKDFLACVFYGSGAEAALAVPASNRSVIAHNVCGDIIIGNSFFLGLILNQKVLVIVLIFTLDLSCWKKAGRLKDFRRPAWFMPIY